MESDISKLSPRLVSYFAKLIEKDKLVHAYLFSGPTGSKKMRLATCIAQGIFCKNLNNGYPCGKCFECRRIQSQSHPDVVVIDSDESTIKVDQIRYLKTEFSKSGVEGRKKVFIINNIEKMTSSASNSLLKFLEEPSGEVTIFLLTSQLQKILETIISRCQMIEIPSLSVSQMLDKLVNIGIDSTKAHILAYLTKDVALAQSLALDDDFSLLVGNIWKWYYAILSLDMQAFVDVTVKIMPYAKNKENQKLIFDLIVLLCRDSLLLKYGQTKKLAFAKYHVNLEERLIKIPALNLITGNDFVLDAIKKSEYNVNFQNILEKITLGLIDCYKKR